MNEQRCVLDTNVLISALLLESSVPAIALQKAEAQGVVLYSHATLSELTHVLLRPKFSRYITTEQVEGLLARIRRAWQKVSITHQIRACHDPKDDMFLELAINGEASILMTGDKDLLALSPYRKVQIITPSLFVS